MNADTFKSYFDMMVTQRDWSWSIVALAYLFVSLYFRFRILCGIRTLVKEVKNRDWYRDARRQYFKHSAAGWVLFFVPVVIVSLLWHKGHLSPVTPQDAVLLLVGILFYFLSLILHLYAFSSAALSTLKQHINKDRF